MKVKANDKFSFPLSIDFGPYQTPDAVDKQTAGQQYVLQAILVHKGSAASQGHYGEPLLSPHMHAILHAQPYSAASKNNKQDLKRHELSSTCCVLLQWHMCMRAAQASGGALMMRA